MTKTLDRDYIKHVTSSSVNYAALRKINPQSTVTGNMAIVNAAVDFESGCHQILKEQEYITPLEVLQMREMLIEAKLQLEYMQGKFQETGSGNQVISQIVTILSKVS
jgi:hypothetical protein